jgi:fused signal recognition particle receptor
VRASLREKVDRKQIGDVEELKRVLKEELRGILTAAEKPVNSVDGEPEVILVVGVNGTGKTTTIGKLAHNLRAQGKSVLLCAADTFRAAAIEQLEIWGERTGTEVIKTKPGGDPSAVLFDALQAARARKVDYVIVDTAGRLHTKANLMSELDKMRRTAQRIIAGAPHETLLVMDATTGQNGLQQAKLFTASAGVTGIVLTKLDGTAKGGIVVAISREMGLPVRYVGVGEKQGDLLPFRAEDFVESLFAK